MRTYTIQHKATKTNFITTDFMDVWNQFDTLPQGEPLEVIVQEMTVDELNKELKRRANDGEPIN
jgi:hypothetical protein